MQKTHRGIQALFVTATVSVWAGTASANLTTVQAPAAGEQSQYQILSTVYGVTFLPAVNNALSYTSGPGGITATRVDDFLAGGGQGTDLHLVDVPAPGNTDQQWVDGIASVRAEARFAAYSQQFGYSDALHPVYENLFNVTGSQYAVSGSASHQFSMGVPWNWARSGQGGTFYSQESRNNNEDHMVTYQITGLTGLDPGEAVWMLFWEDLRGPYGCGSDRDFNDLAVEVRASAVPLPGADILAMIGFAGVSVLRYRRKA
ncbi:MAG: DUF4114 domain-containing protein [Planctomycetota bacterium]